MPPTDEVVPARLLDKVLDQIESSSNLVYNLAMLAFIMLSSAGTTLVLWALVKNWHGLDLPARLDYWVAAIALVVSAMVATPAMFLGTALVDRLQRSGIRLRQALISADDASRAKTAFLATMSHEIRTPLNGVLGMAQVLETSDLSPDQREALRMIGESGDLLLAIIGDVLDLARIESGQVALDPSPGPLVSPLRGMVELFRFRAQEAGTELTFTLSGPLPQHVVMDSVRVRQALGNLVSNAVKFTRDGKVSVTLSAQPCEGAQGSPDGGSGWDIILDVRDTGIGIAPDTLARLFQPFEQATADTARKFGGTGLGLAISRRLARQMGGDITVTSALGEGSCFRFRFRVVEAAASVTSMDAARPLPKVELSGRRILVVDDSRINRRVVAGLLRPLGATCLEAEGGQAALAILQETAVDLVLLDINMPGMDGPAVLQALRGLAAPASRTPVIALTADAINRRREDYLALGFQGYLVKPLQRAALVAELANMPARHMPTPAALEQSTQQRLST